MLFFVGVGYVVFFEGVDFFEPGGKSQAKRMDAFGVAEFTAAIAPGVAAGSV